MRPLIAEPKRPAFHAPLARPPASSRPAARRIRPLFGRRRNVRVDRDYLEEINRIEATHFFQPPVAMSAGNGGGKSDGSLNLNSKNFNSDTFVSNLILHKGLDELVTVEEDLVQSVRRLDYELQHLVYENYNKFLTATNTVRKMQTEFGNMDAVSARKNEDDNLPFACFQQMESLTTKIDRISELSTGLSEEFAANRTKSSNLSESSKTIKTLQSLVTLPSRMRTLIEEGNFQAAGRLFKKFRSTLQKTKDFNAVQGIYRETMGYVNRIERHIWANLENPLLSSEEFINQARILLQIGMESEQLKAKLTEIWTSNLEKALVSLEKHANGEENPSKFTDILNFVDNGVCPFLADVSLGRLPPQRALQCEGELMRVVRADMHRVKDLLTRRFEAEDDPGECALFVKSLDRVYRKINACCQLLPNFEFAVENTAMVLDAAHHQIQICRRGIRANATAAFTQIRDNYDAPKVEANLVPLIAKLEQTFVSSVKSALANLLLFTASDVTFLRNAESETHNSTFGVDVHEQVVVGSIQDLCEVMAEVDGESTNHEFCLLLSMVLHSLTRKNLKYTMDLCQEQYKIEEDVAENLLTRAPDLTKVVLDCALKLLEKYVELNSIKMFEVLNADGENWNEATATPTDVRKETLEFMKRIRKLDQRLQLLVSASTDCEQEDRSLQLDDSTKKERTPESIRNSRKLNLTTGDQRTFGSAIEKMWADAVEDFAAPVLEFKRHSILGCLVDKSLRLFLGWVRERKFSRAGVQQLQIDSFFFKQNLWKFVADEMQMNVLIDEALSAAVNSCQNPLLLQPPAVKEICNRHEIH
ncbi:Vacuolar protein sorting-associated protein 51-like protein [Aphelenchoides fujianensis]|nr:Vacuolar protein sorting-associated protein 51-like protein [Aphelenchoides fujianensis]